MKRLALYVLVFGYFVAALPATVALAQDDGQAQRAELNERASKLDPDNYQFVQPVCTRCHMPDMFLHSRSWSEWQGIFKQMSGYGATATDEQWDHIQQYFLKNLTLIDVNHADEDELSGVLGVNEDTAIKIVQRRADQKFQNAEELEAVPGVTKEQIERIRPRLLFAPLPSE